MVDGPNSEFLYYFILGSIAVVILIFLSNFTTTVAHEAYNICVEKGYMGYSSYEFEGFYLFNYNISELSCIKQVEYFSNNSFQND